MSEAIADKAIADEAVERPVLESRTVYHGLVWDVQRDRVDLGPGGIVDRDLIRHPGAVAVVALDEADRIALVQQYRHPVRVLEWEVPAGLLDIAGEEPLRTAARELAEEADLQATDWAVLTDYFTSPGYTSEAIRIYLARGISDLPAAARHTREGEEWGMPLRWLPLDAALDAVLAGRIHNPHTVIAILATHAARARDWRDLRPADSPWPLWERQHSW